MPSRRQFITHCLGGLALAGAAQAAGFERPPKVDWKSSELTIPVASGFNLWFSMHLAATQMVSASRTIYQPMLHVPPAQGSLQLTRLGVNVLKINLLAKKPNRTGQPSAMPELRLIEGLESQSKTVTYNDTEGAVICKFQLNVTYRKLAVEHYELLVELKPA